MIGRREAWAAEIERRSGSAPAAASAAPAVVKPKGK